MGGFTYAMVSKSVIKVDGTYIDTGEISSISDIVKSGTIWSFSVMFCGHSNVLWFESESEEEAQLKLMFVVEEWCKPMDMENISEFDMANYADAEDTEDDETELN